MRKLEIFTNKNLKFGDYILFQKYSYLHDYDKYKISKPILAIYLGSFIADQTLGFNYVKWNNENHSILITNKHVTNYRVCQEVEKIESHIEWYDYIDILGHWTNKPGWKEIIQEYRKQNLDLIIDENNIITE